MHISCPEPTATPATGSARTQRAHSPRWNLCRHQIRGSGREFSLGSCWFPGWICIDFMACIAGSSRLDLKKGMGVGPSAYRICASAHALIPRETTRLKKRGSAYSSTTSPGPEIRTILMKIVNSCDLKVTPTSAWSSAPASGRHDQHPLTQPFALGTRLSYEL